MSRLVSLLILPLLAVILVPDSGQAQSWRSESEFVAELDRAGIRQTDVIWAPRELRDELRGILPTLQLGPRIRYHRGKGYTAWQFRFRPRAEIHHVGVIVRDGRVHRLGFIGTLSGPGRATMDRGFLDRLIQHPPVDAVSGATMSSQALAGVVKLAGHLHRHVSPGGD